MIRADVAETVNRDEFFVFEDLLDEIMLAFSRDWQVLYLPAMSVLQICLTIAKCGGGRISGCFILSLSSLHFPFPPLGTINLQNVCSVRCGQGGPSVMCTYIRPARLRQCTIYVTNGSCLFPKYYSSYIFASPFTFTTRYWLSR